MEETTVTQTQGHTQYQMMTTRTLHPSPANRLQPSGSQTCDRCSPAPLGAVCFLMHQQILFEDHGVCSGVITDSLVLERAVCEPRALVQPLLTAVQLGNRQKGGREEVQLLLDLTVTGAFPAHTSEFALQILDLTHVWSTTEILAQSALTTSLPWPLPTCTSSWQQRYPLQSPKCLQPSQRCLLDRNLMTSQDSTTPAPSSKSHAQNSGCCNRWAVN